MNPKNQPNGAAGGDRPPTQNPEIILAKWSTRFWAWLVDFMVVNVALAVLFGLLSMPMWLYGFTNPGMIMMTRGMMTSSLPYIGGEWWWNGGFGGPFSFAISSLVFFAYWTYMESRHEGRSIGKMLLHIRTTNLEGNQADTTSIAISSFGKAFLLPIDVFFGWIFTNDKRQRLLSRAAKTIVIKTTNDDNRSTQSTAKYLRE
ncbi:RDD family protein [Candidatus Nitrososphaera evergladensis]|nr:RDD family protein [Candidatus Nitrososphaera evergladensis]